MRLLIKQVAPKNTVHKYSNFTRIISRHLCINMNNHQNAIFHPLDNFIKHNYNFAMAIFHKITYSAKLVILLIVPTYAKVSM